MNNRQNEAKLERMRERREAGLVSDRYPGVASIVLCLTYTRRGTKTLLRTLNFCPTSDAFFRLDCLSKECVEGGFDLTKLITATIKKRAKVAKGELKCKGEGPTDGHSDISYEVSVKYSKP